MAKLRTTISRGPYAPRACSPGGVPAGSGCMRDCTPEPCAQVRILLGAPKSNTQANHILLVICHLTWANVRHAHLSPAARAPGTSQNPDDRRLVTSAPWRAATIKTVYSLWGTSRYEPPAPGGLASTPTGPR